MKMLVVGSVLQSNMSYGNLGYGVFTNAASTRG